MEINQSISSSPKIPKKSIEPGQFVRLRGRNAIVESVQPGGTEVLVNLVQIKYLDEYQPAEELVLWEIERSKEILSEKEIPEISNKPATNFNLYCSYINSLRWSSKIAYPSESLIFLTGPMRSSIRLHSYQLWPVFKAMLMPSVRLFIADDVGLGKTIEAGLVMQELIAQRGIKRILVISTATLQRQWRDELEQKFHQSFQIVDRDEVAKIKQIDPNSNPWLFHQKVIVSMDFLKRPEVLEDFETACRKMAPIGSGRLPWDLIIVDEIHNYAPLPGGEESERTRMLMKLLRYFEHRVFLSATPHNGFHYSFMGLLNLLDPVRFQRKSGLSDDDKKHIKTVFVRRLKEDVNRDDPPQKFIIRDTPEPIVSDPSPQELKLYEALRRYDSALRQIKGISNQERQAFNFIRTIFKKRLLSSPYAFARTWYSHLSKIEGIEIGAGQYNLEGTESLLRVIRSLKAESESEIIDDSHKDEIDRDASKFIGQLLTSYWPQLEKAANDVTKALIQDMGVKIDLLLSEGKPVVRIPDSKTDAFIEWIKARIKWDGMKFNSDERAIIFTEYRDTQEYLLMRLLAEGIPTEKILIINGSSGQDHIEYVKESFNDPDSEVCLLLATDAAREGLNLQRTCRYVIHHDLPWNPLKIDQRIGRVDRYGQFRKVQVWHHILKTIEEYEFLAYIAEKIEVARTDLGRLSPILEESIESIFIPDEEISDLNQAKTRIVNIIQEKQEDIITSDAKTDYEKVGRIIEDSMKKVGIDQSSMKQLLESALRLDGGSLEEITDNIYRIKGPDSWSHCLDKIKDVTTGAQRDVTFNSNLFIKKEGKIEIWDERNDIRLLSLGHPIITNSLQRLRKYVWSYDIDRNPPITKWAIDPSINDIREISSAIISILRIARNIKGEVIDEEVETFRYRSSDKILELYEFEIDFTCNKKNIFTGPPEWLGELMESLKSKVESDKREFSTNIIKKLKTRMDKDSTDYDTWRKNSLNMLEEAAKRSISKELEKLDRQIEIKEYEKKQLRLDPVLNIKLRMDLDQLKKEREELKERLSERRLSELKDHINREADKFIREIFPSRYTLGHVDIIVAGILFIGSIDNGS